VGQGRPERPDGGVRGRAAADAGVQPARGTPGQLPQPDVGPPLGPQQVGQQGDRVPGLHQVHVQQQVGAVEPDVGLEPGRAQQSPRPPAGPGVRRVQHPRRTGELGQRCGRPAERPLDRENQPDLVPEQVLLLDAGSRRTHRVGVLLPQDDVEVVRQQAGDRRRRLGLGDLDPQPRVQLGQPGERGRHQRQQHALEGRDPQRAGDVGQRGGELRLGLLQPLQHGVGVADEDPRLLGEPHPAADPLQQPHPRLGLQLGELLADRGGAVGERPRHLGEGAPAGQLAEQSQAVDVEHADLRIVQLG
jgi:hypothetical protein